MGLENILVDSSSRCLCALAWKLAAPQVCNLFLHHQVSPQVLWAVVWAAHKCSIFTAPLRDRGGGTEGSASVPRRSTQQREGAIKQRVIL